MQSYYNSRNPNNDIFSLILQALDKSIDPALRLAFQRQMMLEQINSAAYRQQLKAEIKSEVLAEIYMDIDVSQALQKIKELQDAINQLGK